LDFVQKVIFTYYSDLCCPWLVCVLSCFLGIYFDHVD
jgi:hypothetical protein